MYREIGHVPPKWKTLDAYTLTLEQINQIVNDAQTSVDKSGDNFAVCLERSRQEFRKTHQPVDGMWRAK